MSSIYYTSFIVISIHLLCECCEPINSSWNAVNRPYKSIPRPEKKKNIIQCIFLASCGVPSWNVWWRANAGFMSTDICVGLYCTSVSFDMYLQYTTLYIYTVLPCNFNCYLHYEYASPLLSSIYAFFEKFRMDMLLAEKLLFNWIILIYSIYLNKIILIL